MKYTIVKTKRFKTAFKRVEQLPGFKSEVFIAVIGALAAGERLDITYKNHRLTGSLKAFHECHLAPDILLLYQIDNGLLILTLVSVGSHAHLFK